MALPQQPEPRMMCKWCGKTWPAYLMAQRRGRATTVCYTCQKRINRAEFMLLDECLRYVRRRFPRVFARMRAEKLARVFAEDVIDITQVTHEKWHWRRRGQ